MLHLTRESSFARRLPILLIACFAVTFVCIKIAGPKLFVEAQAQGSNGTRLLRTPTVSANQIAFAYAQNIWTVPRSGGAARRLTSFPGQTTNPHFSPDGKWIAFSGEYAGNVDVYVVSSEGGEPKRLTWHPGADSVQGWTPDGKSIVFASSRATAAPSGAPRFWTVPARGRAGGGRGARGKVVRVRVRARARRAERRAAFLDGAGAGRRRGADGAAARLPGKNLAGRYARRLPDEQLLGRGTPQLSRRTEPPDLDRRSQDLRSRVAAVEGFEGRRSGLGRRTG